MLEMYLSLKNNFIIIIIIIIIYINALRLDQDPYSPNVIK